MPLRRFILIALLLVGFTASFASAGLAQMLSADEKALAVYKLTMPNVKKAMAAVQILAEEAAKDPKVQEHQKLKKQIESLQAKDELTEAEQAQLDKLQERLEALEREAEGKEDDSLFSNAQTIDSMEAAMKKHPAGAAALAKAGISAREYSMTMMALLQAALIEGMSQGKVDLKNLPPGVNADNILFVREHKAELEAMQKMMEKKG
jgi:hypothetical protein